jgi:hypothetical protein
MWSVLFDAFSLAQIYVTIVFRIMKLIVSYGYIWKPLRGTCRSWTFSWWVSLCQVLEELSAIAETNGFPTRGGLTDLPAHPAASHPLPPGTFSKDRGQCWGSVTSVYGSGCESGSSQILRICRIRLRIRLTDLDRVLMLNCCYIFFISVYRYVRKNVS